MWMSGQKDTSQTATSDSTKESNAAQSSENSYKPLTQCKLLLECADEKLSLLQQEITAPFPESSSTEVKIKKYTQYLHAAYQIAKSLLDTIPVLLADVRVNPTNPPNNNNATNSNANANDPDSVEGIQNLAKTKEIPTEEITVRIIRGLVNLLETRVAEIKSEPIEPELLTAETVAQGPYTKENLLQDSIPRPRSASLIREEKLKALFQQQFCTIKVEKYSSKVELFYTLLHLSIIAENTTMLRLAIQYNVNPYQEDIFNNQAIHYALRRPSMLSILLEKPILNKKPLNLNEFYHNGNNLQTFIGLERNQVDPLDLPGYDLLKDFRKACFSLNKDFFCTLATSYFDSLAMNDEIMQELTTYMRRTDLTPTESLRFNVLMTMNHINEITAPYQKLIHQLFFHDKVSLADFTLPANVDPDEHSKHIVDLCNKHCGTEADDKGQATQERNQLNVVARAHLKFIDFIPHFRAMHEAIATRFPIWKTDLHAHLREICRLAIEDFCSTRLSALLAFLTGQYRQLESLAMQESYQQRMTAVLLAETADLGAEYFSAFTESFNQGGADNYGDDDNSFRDCPSDDDDNTPKNTPLMISEPALLALQKRGADIIIILRFLSHERMRTAAREWATTLNAIKKDNAMSSAAFSTRGSATASTSKENSKIPSSPSKPKLFSIPGLAMALSLGNSNPNSAANSPRTNGYNTPRTPGGSPRTNISASSYNSSPRLNRSGNLRLSANDARELSALNSSGTRISAAAARNISNLLQRESTPPMTPRGGSSPKLEKAHSYPGVRNALLAAAKAAAAANTTATITPPAATASTSSLAQSTIPERHSINFEDEANKSSSNIEESNPSNIGDDSSVSSDSDSSTNSSSSSRSNSPPPPAQLTQGNDNSASKNNANPR